MLRANRREVISDKRIAVFAVLPAHAQQTHLGEVLDVYGRGEERLAQASVYGGKLYQILEVEVHVGAWVVAVDLTEVELPVGGYPEIVVRIREVRHRVCL